MYYILPFFLFVSVVISNFFFSITSSAIDGAIDSISKNLIVEATKSKGVDDESISYDDLYIDSQLFEKLYIEQFKNNLGYYQGRMEIGFAYYNVNTLQECNHKDLVCNGVQVKISLNSFSFFIIKDKYVRYEINVSKTTPNTGE